jgi:hypothetical protein
VVWRLENAEFQSPGLEPDLVTQKAIEFHIDLSLLLNPQSSIVLVLVLVVDLVLDFPSIGNGCVEIENDTGRRGSFLIVVVVVLDLLVRKAIDDDDEDEGENEKTREFPDRPRGRRRPRSPTRKAIDHDHDDEHEDD